MTRTRPTFPAPVPQPARGNPFSTIGLVLRMMPVGAIVFGVLIFSQSDPPPGENPNGDDFKAETVPGTPSATAAGKGPAAPGEQLAGRLDPRIPGTPDALSARVQPQGRGEGALAAGMQAGPNLSVGDGMEESQGAGSGVTDASAPPVPPTSSNPEAEYGVEVASLRMTAGGTALDFRYRVLDPDKAAVVGREGGPSYLLTQDGRRISPRQVQQIGDYYSARHLDQAGRTYSTWFANQGGALQSGDLVSVVIGDLHIANIRVE